MSDFIKNAVKSSGDGVLARLISAECTARMKRLPDFSRTFIEAASVALAGEIVPRELRPTREEAERMAAIISSRCLAVILCSNAPPSKGALRDEASSAAREAVAQVMNHG